MRKTILAILLLLNAAAMMAARGDSAAVGYTVETTPNTRLRDVRQHVSDPAGLLSQAARDTINMTLANLERTTGIEVAVVMLPSIGGDDVFDFSVRLFRSWGIGKKKSNNGLLILYVEDQRKVRFATGYGIEGTLTDATSKRIQMRYMVPAFKRGDRDGGMVAGVKAASAVLDGTMKPEADDNGGGNALTLLLLAIGVGAMVFLVTHRRKYRCPQCGAKALMHKSTDHYRMGGMRYRKDVYVCSKCGKVVVRDTPEDDRGGGNGIDPLLTGMLLGSMFGRGGGGGGGGFSGGSYGGGSTGGGGSESGW